MNLEKLVPPLELCKLIPQGEFADSALVWLEIEIPQKNKKEWRVVNRTKPIEYCHNPKHPAPTLQEIMAELNSLPGVLTPTAFIHQDTWTVDCAVDASGNLVGMITEDFMHVEDIKNLDVKKSKDKNPATAALKLWLELDLKLWLELKGIEE